MNTRKLHPYDDGCIQLRKPYIRDFHIANALLRQAASLLGKNNANSVYIHYHWSLAATANAASDFHIDTGGDPMWRVATGVTAETIRT